MVYRVNAGYLAPTHWTQGPEGGGRIIGEACHMFDLFQFLVAPAKVAEVVATPVQADVEHISGGDNVVTTVRYTDGSVATLLYTALGAADYPKEMVEIYADGKVLALDDYKALRVHGAQLAGWQAPLADKGHITELQAFARYVRGESAAPMTVDELVETTKVSFIASGQSV